MKIPTLKQMGGVYVMSIEHPQTRIWLCVRCGDLWEMLPGVNPQHGPDGRVLCGRCCGYPWPEIVL